MKHLRQLKQVTLSGFVLALLLSFVFTVQLNAQASNANAADGLQISPTIVEVNGEKGKSYTVELKLTNVTASDLTFDSMVNDFSAKDETGTPSVNLDTTKPSTASIREWVNVIGSFTLKARETRIVSTTLRIPINAEPGGHYGVIRFSGRTPELEGSGVGTSASAGTLMLVRVAGAVDEKLDLLTFQTTLDGNPTGFFEYGPITFAARFENKGNVHVKPIGQIEIRNIFGNKVDTLEVNADKGNVLPLSIRRFDSTLDKRWMFGPYTADISIAYGTTGQAIVKTITFWVIPYKQLLILIAAIVTVVFVFRNLIKRYNSYIIKRANTPHGNKTKHRKK